MRAEGRKGEEVPPLEKETVTFLFSQYLVLAITNTVRKKKKKKKENSGQKAFLSEKEATISSAIQNTAEDHAELSQIHL